MGRASLPAIDGAQSLALSGVSVVEAGQGVSAAFAAKLMALMGATVMKVEPPDGDVTRRRGPFPGDNPDPENSGLFRTSTRTSAASHWISNRGDARTLDELIGGADILIHNIPPYERAACGLDSDVLSREPSPIDRYRDLGLRRMRPARRLSRL